MTVNGDGQLRSVTVGVDVGGTTITAVVVDTALQMRGQITRATDKNSPRHTVDSIVAAVTEALDIAKTPLTQVCAIGMGIPGKVDIVTGTVNLAVNLNWDDIPAGPLFSEIFGVPCYLENDLRLAALGYYRFFSNGAIQNMAYVSVGTGLAAGLILDGRLHRGSNGMAGEIGHMVIDPEGPLCNCGNRGCLEMYTAGPAYARAGEAAVAQGKIACLRGKVGVTAVDIFQAAQLGDTAAQEIVDTIGATLGRGLQSLIAAYDVDKIILGGGVARAGDIFLQSIRHEWQRQAKLSPLAAEMLQPEKLECAPPEGNAGAWGGVALALNHTQTTNQTALITERR